jgi:hypothetical protein
MTLSHFENLLRFITDQINKNQFPRTPTLWDAWVKNLTETAIDDSVNLFTAEVRILCGVVCACVCIWVKI